MEAGAVRNSGQSVMEVSDNLMERASVVPWRSNFGPLRGSRYGVKGTNVLKGRVLVPGGEQVENVLRGSLFMDTYTKARTAGQSADDAANLAHDAVVKHHFDYDNLSDVERNVFRRIVPFYTWTRRNVPLMLEAVAKQPGKVNNYLALKQNVEFGQEQEGVIPQWLVDSGAIRVGGDEESGSYFTPDIPLQSLFEMTDDGPRASLNPADNAGLLWDVVGPSMSPLIKTPLEMYTGRQVFNDQPFTGELNPVPTAWAVIPGLVPALKGLGMVRSGANGQPYMTDRSAYIVEQYLPVFGRTRRLFPSEERFDERQHTTMLSFFFGVGARENGRASQISELYRRRDDIERRLDEQRQLGFVEEEPQEYSGTAWFDRVLAEMGG
jgi:hypothetical protein